jgi:hypothetical protein
MLDGVRRHAHGRGDVESATAGFGQPGTRIGNDDSLTHFCLPVESRFWFVKPLQHRYFAESNRNGARHGPKFSVS